MTHKPRIEKPITPLKASDVMPHGSTMTKPDPQTYIQADLLEELVEIYFDHQLKHGIITKTTYRNYRIHIRPFMEWWKVHGPQNGYQLNRDMLHESLEWIKNEYRSLKDKPLAHTTIEDCFTRVRSMFAWLYRNNCTGTVNLAEWCPRLPRSRPNLYYPTIEEMQTLISQPNGEYRLRDTAIMAFLLSTGARLFETAAVVFDCVTFETPITNLDTSGQHGGYCHLRKTKFDNLGLRGGRHVVFCSKTGLLLKAYLRTVNRGLGDFLFGVSDSGISQMIKRYTKVAGFDEISPHAFRRCFSDNWQDKHRRRHKTQLKFQLGHSIGVQDVTEDRYTNPDNPLRTVRDIREFYVSPLDEIEIDWRAFPVHIE